MDEAEALPNPSMPDEVRDAELDELFAFIGAKKQYLYPDTRRPQNPLLVRLGSGWGTNPECAIQQLVDEAPKAKWHYSDRLDTYAHLWYHLGRYEVSEGKSETYSAEADNSELRHCLARLARNSRCFSRYPKYPAHLMDFTSHTISHSVTV